MENGAILDLEGLQALIDALHDLGYRVMGPMLRDGALVLAEISTLDGLPQGIGDEQGAGRYRTRPRGDAALFGFAATAQSAKPVLFPADERLWRGVRSPTGVEVSPTDPEPAPVALLGIRGCDLAAINIHVVWTPMRDPSMMSQEAKDQLGFF